MPDIYLGPDAANSDYRIADDEPNLVVEHIPSGTYWQYNESESRWESTAGVDLGGNDLSNVGSLGADEVNKTEVINESRYSGDLGADINSAVAALPSNGGKIVIAPRDDGSRYTLNTKGVIDKQVTLAGPGRGTPLIDVQSDVVAIEAQTYGVTLEDLNLTAGNLTSHTSTLTHIGGRCTIRNCYVQYAGDNNIAITDAYSSQSARVINCRSVNAGENTPGTEDDPDKEGNALLVARSGQLTWTGMPDGTGVNEMHIESSELAGATQNGCSLYHGSTHTLSGNLYNANGASGLYLGPGGRASTAFGGHFEANTNESVRTDTQHPAATVITSQLPNGVTDNHGATMILEGGIFTHFREFQDVPKFRGAFTSETADSMTANPEADTEDGYIEVQIAGSSYQIPLYTP